MFIINHIIKAAETIVIREVGAGERFVFVFGELGLERKGGENMGGGPQKEKEERWLRSRYRRGWGRIVSGTAAQFPLCINKSGFRIQESKLKSRD